MGRPLVQAAQVLLGQAGRHAIFRLIFQRPLFIVLNTLQLALRNEFHNTDIHIDYTTQTYTLITHSEATEAKINMTRGTASNNDHMFVTAFEAPRLPGPSSLTRSAYLKFGQFLNRDKIARVIRLN